MSRRLKSALLPAIVTALAYALIGWLSVGGLAFTPGFAAPLYPAAGIALAAVLVYGPRMTPAVALGALAVSAVQVLSTPGSPVRAAGVLVALAIAIGAAMQAAIGAALVRRVVGAPLTLSEPRDIARFFLCGAVLACMVSPTVAVIALKAGHALPASGPMATWALWWIGDALGVVIGAPVALTLIGRPHGEWAHRRKTVGVSLVALTVLLAFATAQVARWDEQRTRVIFERDARYAQRAFEDALEGPLHALREVHDAAAARGEMTRATLRTAAEHWLAPRYRLTAIGWAPLVPREEVPAFEAEVRRELGLPDFHVIERTDADAAPRPRGDAEVFAIRYLEPAPADAHVLGLNPLSIAAARPAIEATRVDGRPAASAPFQLLHESGDRTAVVVYQALRSADGTHTLGVVFVTLRIGDTLHAVAATLPGYLQWCLVDRTSAKPLAESPGCGAASSAFVHRASIDFAGRPWDLVLAAPAAAVPDSRSWRNAWLFSIVGLCATAMLGALLLSVTGRTRRIEVAVDARTADLRREVAERARTEAALRESEQRFRNMFDHVPIGVIYTDLDGRIHEANPKLREMLGHGGTELGRMSAAELVHPSDRLAFAELAQRLVRGDITSFRRRTRFVTAGGRVIWAQVSVSLLRDEQGRPERLVGVVEDITEHLKLQEAEHARESAEAANRAKSEFVSRMSHELRTPLNAMLGFTQLLELDAQAPLAPHQVEWTSQIQQAGWHLLHMINDTLDLSRIESGALRLEIVPVHVAAVVEATCSLIEQQAERRRVRIERRLDPEAPALLGDETRIKQILTNLLSNAVKYNVDGGRVLIASRRLDEHQVEIEVHDTGIGLSGPQMAELFQPFNRLGREQYGEGTGIGLVISRRLAELMGGSLRAESKAGQGSSFRLQLPLAPAAPGAPAADLPEASGAPPDYRQRQVHYIEDNETNAEVMRGILAQRPQVHLEVWHRGLEGLAAVQQLRPHLVLLDMHLPDIDGLDLLRRLKEDPRSASVPVIVVSADATGARIEQALALGAVNYVTKPVNVADMLALLDQVLEQQETHFGADLHD